MKKVLSLLLAFVFVHVQAYALSGGPQFSSGGGSSGSGGGLNIIGTYGGTLLPGDVAEEGGAGDQARATTIGLFTFAVNESGPTIGSAVVFVDGIAFNGVITGIVDPGTGTVSCIVDAASTLVFQSLIQTGVDPNTGNPIFATVDSNIFAQGTILGTITSPTRGVAIDITTGLNPGTTRIEGTATLDVFFDFEPDGSPIVNTSVTYLVSGFKQSDTAAPAMLDVGGNINNAP